MTEEVLKEYPNGMKVVRNPDLYNEVDKRVSRDYQLIDTDGSFICHADEVSDFDSIWNNSKRVKFLKNQV